MKTKKITDLIYVMENGNIVDKGDDYQYCKSNSTFNKMTGLNES